VFTEKGWRGWYPPPPPTFGGMRPPHPMASPLAPDFFAKGGGVGGMTPQGTFFKQEKLGLLGFTILREWAEGGGWLVKSHRMM